MNGQPAKETLNKEMIDFKEKIKDLATEKKIHFSIEEMKKALNREDKPDFKTFWDIKNICLELFKETLNNSLRTLLWKEYLEVSNEAKRIKNLLFQETDFEIEQIDLAIKSIEDEISRYDCTVDGLKNIELDLNAKTLLQKKNYYLQTQKELNLLNSFVVRINSLRKEIIKIQMRLNNKAKFLQRLEIAGDFVFPKRKELIEVMSNEFVLAIDTFEKKFNLTKTPFFVLKEEIKNLQNAAKSLTINTKTYMSSRISLSKCWDKVKSAEKEYKDQKEAERPNLDAVLVKIDVLKTIIQNNPDDKNIDKEEKEILNFIQTLNLKIEDQKFLKNKIKEAKNPILEKKISEKKEKIKKENELTNIKKEKLENLKNLIINILDKSSLTSDELIQEKQNIEKELVNFELESSEKLIFKKYLRLLDHLIDDKDEQHNQKSLDDLNNLHLVFENKKQRKSNIKNYLDSLNKELATSNFDFEKAMIYRELIDFEKEKLDIIDKSIDELEDKISELESN